MWNIARSYGIPRKVVRVITGIHEGFKCAAIENGETSDWFNIKSGVKQWCVMSGFRFLLIMGWVMRRTKADKWRNGWNFSTMLEDLDFAGDIALLSSKSVVYVRRPRG